MKRPSLVPQDINIIPQETSITAFGASITSYSPKSSYKPGFLLGAGVELSLAKNVAIEIDGLYFRKGSEVKSFYNDILYERKNYVLNVGESRLLKEEGIPFSLFFTPGLRECRNTLPSKVDV